MRKTWVIVGVGITLMVAALAWIFIQPAHAPKQSRQLSDGSILSLERVALASSNEFRHGNALERVLNRAIPAKGVRLGQWRLRRPEIDSFQNALATSLTFQFKVSKPPGAVQKIGNATLVPMGSDRSFRAVIAGEDGFEYVSELGNFRQYRDGLYGYLSTTIFPRDARTMVVRLQHSDSSGWQTIAEFSRSQRPAAAADWKPEPEPRLRTSGGIQVRLGEVTVRPGTYIRGDIWEQTVLIPWRITVDGNTLTNWNAHDVVIRDASGNADYFGVQKAVTNGWIIDRLWRSLDPHKVWKIKADFAQDSDFAAADLFAARLPYRFPGVMETNLGRYPLRFGFENSGMLSVELLATNRTDLRLSFVRAEDETGQNIADWTGSWSQFRFRRLIRTPPAGGVVVATFAISKNVPVEFTIQPRLLPRAQSD